MSQRLDDPYGQYADYLVGRPKGRVVRDGREVVEVIYDELEVPSLDLGVIFGQTKVGQPAQAAPVTSSRPATPVAPGRPAAPPPATPAKPRGSEDPNAIPVYGADFRLLVNKDFQDSARPLPHLPMPGGDIRDRIEEAHEFGDD